MKSAPGVPPHIQAMIPVRDDTAIAQFLKSKLGDSVKSLLVSTGRTYKGKPVRVPLDMFERLCPKGVRGYTLAR